MMAQGDNPNEGPFPDGDSRNVTATRSTNALEPERTGPQENKARGDDAAEAKDEQSLMDTIKEAPGELIASLTPETGAGGLFGGLVDKVRDAYDVGKDDKSAADKSAADTGEHVTTKVDLGTPAEPYTLQQDAEPGAADNAFGVKGGGLTEPVLQKDWNPAERNSDDLSR